MTPKEKAIQLIEKYDLLQTYLSDTKECALIAVNEIIDLLPNINLIPPIQRRPDEFYRQYWYSVKREIEKL